MATLTDVNGIGPAMAKKLTAAGIKTVAALASATPTTLAQIQGLSADTAAVVISEAKKAPATAAKAPAAKAPAKSSSKTSSSDIKKLKAKVAKQNKRIQELEKTVKALKKNQKRKKK